MSVSFVWRGRDVEERVNGAIARGLVAVGYSVASEAKQIVHRETGTLSRSIHLARVGYTGSLDLQKAAAIDLLQALPLTSPSREGRVYSLEVGSWLPYACVEENLHPYMAPAYQLVARRAERIFKHAFDKERLK